MASVKTLDVAVAVIIDASAQVLISFRHAGLHQGNLWEFPGGKLEPGESVETALRRELMEELGLEIRQCFPLQTILHEYPDKSVRLHVWRITSWVGQAHGLEGQAIAWKSAAELDPQAFPPANAAIVKTLKLPPLIAITPIVASLSELESVMRHLLSQDLTVIQLRQPQLSAASYLEWFRVANKLCKARQVKLMFNGDMADFPASDATGYHANSARLRTLAHRPVVPEATFSASCHNLEELQKAAALSANFVTLSPVGETSKYLSSATLGWSGFEKLLRQTSVPVYALGGLSRRDLVRATCHGAQGICGIGMFHATLK